MKGEHLHRLKGNNCQLEIPNPGGKKNLKNEDEI